MPVSKRAWRNPSKNPSTWWKPAKKRPMGSWPKARARRARPASRTAERQRCASAADAIPIAFRGAPGAGAEDQADQAGRRDHPDPLRATIPVVNKEVNHAANRVVISVAAPGKNA